MRIDETVLVSSLVRHLSEHNGESQAKWPRGLIAARAWSRTLSTTTDY